MIRPVDEIQVYLCREVVDMRKSINGLSILVEQALGLDPFAPRLFVFCNRKRDKIKILYWERNGFCLWQKRLERTRFQWPRKVDNEVIALTGQTELVDREPALQQPGSHAHRTAQPCAGEASCGQQ